MSTTYCFTGDGVNDVWILPQAPSGELVLSIIQDDGLERRLLEGRDYSLSGNKIIIALAPSARLFAREQASANSAGAVYAAQTAQAAPAYAQASAITEEQAAGALESRYNELSSRLRLEMESLVNNFFASQTDSISRQVQQGLADLAASARKARDEARIHNAPLGSRARLLLPTGCKEGAYLTTESAYLPGTSTLSVFIDGILAAPDVDYEEIGPANEASRAIRMLKALPSGTCLDILVSAISSADSALRAANTAQAAQESAAALLASAQAAESQASKARSAAASEITAAQGWANAAKQSADKAYQASVNAYDAAAQISLYRREPGICAVKDKADIHACSPGLFIINPHLTHAPTPFFGVWPADCIQQMNWDGVFFLGGHCYPDDPALPPKRPAKPKPDPVPLLGGSDEWIPCDHTHQTPPEPCQASCVAWPPLSCASCAAGASTSSAGTSAKAPEAQEDGQGQEDGEE